jgi:hypothetical protein
MNKMKVVTIAVAALMAGTVTASAHGHARHSHAHPVARHAFHEFRSGWFHERMVNPGESYIGIQDRGNAESMGCPC